MLRRHELTDEQWNAIKDLLPGKPGDPGVTAKDNRLFVNALFFVAKTGIPWRDLPDASGTGTTTSFNASTAGARKACSPGSSKCSATPTWRC